MIFPCCKKELPAPLDLTEKVWCACGQSYLPSVIIEYNEMRDIIIGWRDVNINDKVQIICESGEETFVANLMRRGAKFTTERLDCQACKKILPVNEMYSVDACSEECQEIINNQE